VDFRHGVSHRGAHRHEQALEKAEPILLEPVLAVDIFVPSDACRATSTSRRGAADHGLWPARGWDGWDKLTLIPGRRWTTHRRGAPATAGAGFYQARFEHLAEVVGKQARDIVAAHTAKANAG
jgi:elongation factor G